MFQSTGTWLYYSFRYQWLVEMEIKMNKDILDQNFRFSLPNSAAMHILALLI